MADATQTTTVLPAGSASVADSTTPENKSPAPKAGEVSSAMAAQGSASSASSVTDNTQLDAFFSAAKSHGFESVDDIRALGAAMKSNGLKPKDLAGILNTPVPAPKPPQNQGQTVSNPFNMDEVDRRVDFRLADERHKDGVQNQGQYLSAEVARVAGSDPALNEAMNLIASGLADKARRESQYPTSHPLFGQALPPLSAKDIADKIGPQLAKYKTTLLGSKLAAIGDSALRGTSAGSNATSINTDGKGGAGLPPLMQDRDALIRKADELIAQVQGASVAQMA